ncbi:MAG TPA: hypothetical protein ENK18_14515 [Deltaproteobacteria bacterium]|nr:hypothetical protein [Deltaproteobacteria bacterium]
MTLDDLDDQIKTELEQLGFDAGCAWIEEFREERGRDPEPEECDEEASRSAEKIARGRARQLLERLGLRPDVVLIQEIEAVLSAQFSEALEV